MASGSVRFFTLLAVIAWVYSATLRSSIDNTRALAADYQKDLVKIDEEYCQEVYEVLPFFIDNDPAGSCRATALDISNRLPRPTEIIDSQAVNKSTLELVLNDTLQMRHTLVSVQTVNFESLLKKSCSETVPSSGNKCGLTCSSPPNVKAEEKLTCDLTDNIIRLDNLIELLRMEVCPSSGCVSPPSYQSISITSTSPRDEIRAYNVATLHYAKQQTDAIERALALYSQQTGLVTI